MKWTEEGEREGGREEGREREREREREGGGGGIDGEGGREREREREREGERADPVMEKDFLLRLLYQIQSTLSGLWTIRSTFLCSSHPLQLWDTCQVLGEVLDSFSRPQ